VAFISAEYPKKDGHQRRSFNHVRKGSSGCSPSKCVWWLTAKARERGGCCRTTGLMSSRYRASRYRMRCSFIRCSNAAIWSDHEYDPHLIASDHHGRRTPKQSAKTSRELVVRVLSQTESTMRRKCEWAAMHKLQPRRSPMCFEGTFEKVRSDQVSLVARLQRRGRH